MKSNAKSSNEAPDRLFHEPNRLAIMSALCAAGNGMPFTELRDACDLTDGNLNRHLKMLEDANAVRIEKRFVASRPRTTVFVTRRGIDQFNEYLAALSELLQKARRSMAAENRKSAFLPGKAVRA